MHTPANEAIVELHSDEAVIAIPFNQEWANGTGYYDNAVHGPNAPKLERSQVVKFTTPMPNNRRGVIVGTRFGNVVLFERFTDGENGVVVQNVPDEISTSEMIPHGALSYDDVRKVVGLGGNNISHRIEKLFKAAKIHQTKNTVAT